MIICIFCAFNTWFQLKTHPLDCTKGSGRGLHLDLVVMVDTPDADVSGQLTQTVVSFFN